MREHLVDQHVGDRPDAGLARRSTVLGAGSPIGRIGDVGGRVDPLERAAGAVGAAGPLARGTVLDRFDGHAGAVFQGNPLAAVRESAGVFAGDVDPGAIACLEGFPVADHDDELAGRERRRAAGGEVERDALDEPDIGQAHLGGAGVGDLDELEQVVVVKPGGKLRGGRRRRIVHDLGDRQRRVDEQRRLDRVLQRTPS